MFEPAAWREPVRELPDGLHLRPHELSVQVHRTELHVAAGRRHHLVQLQVRSGAVRGESGSGSRDVRMPVLRHPVPCGLHAEPDDVRL